MPDSEFVARAASVLPLAIITFQVLMLRLILRSRAWTLFAIGNLIYLGVRVAGLIIQPFPAVIGFSAFAVGASLIVVGNHLLRDDLYRVLRRAQQNSRQEIQR